MYIFLKGGCIMENSTLYNGKALRLRPQTIFSAIRDGNRTFSEMAPEYGLSLEQFEEQVKLKVGPKEFAKLKKQSERNGERKEKEKQKSYETKPAENVVIETPILGSAETTSKEGDGEMHSKEIEGQLATLESSLESVRQQILAQNAICASKKEVLETEKTNLNRAKDSLKKARKTLANAEKRVAECEKALMEAKSAASNSEEELSSLQTTESELVRKCEELQKSRIYLVAPGYHGEMPKYGHFISIMEIQGIDDLQVEDVRGVELVKQMTAEEFFLFDTMQEAKSSYSFVKLVSKYYFDGLDYTILVDDDSIIELLKRQELYNV